MNKVELVGIVNITPDSFSDGGQFVQINADGSETVDVDKAVLYARDLFRQGAMYVDIGGESTRPGAIPLSPEQEWERIGILALRLIRSKSGCIAIDSYHPETHRRLANARFGEFIINDVTGFNNPDMVSTAAEMGMVCIISHLPATFGTNIQAAHTAKQPMSSISDVAEELLVRRQDLADAGIPKNKIILDPGIGFGKTMELNAKLLEFPAYIKHLDPSVQVMVGYSRKRFLGEHRKDLEPNLRAGRIAVASGANYLRVHDVKGHKELIQE